MIVKKGVNYNTDWQNWTPLRVSVLNSFTELSKQMIKSGALVDDLTFRNGLDTFNQTEYDLLKDTICKKTFSNQLQTIFIWQ